MSMYPTTRNPLTDLVVLPVVSEYQRVPACLCAKTETRLMECYDAYGLELGRYKCTDFKKDYLECVFGLKQRARAEIMRKERHRQFIFGGKKKCYEEPPTMDVHFWW